MRKMMPRSTTRYFSKFAMSPLFLWSWRRDLNPRPSDYKSDALPTELRQPCQVERETGIEPATNSLEGCDSTTELLPQPLNQPFASTHQ